MLTTRPTVKICLFPLFTTTSKLQQSNKALGSGFSFQAMLSLGLCCLRKSSWRSDRWEVNEGCCCFETSPIPNGLPWVWELLEPSSRGPQLAFWWSLKQHPDRKNCLASSSLFIWGPRQRTEHTEAILKYSLWLNQNFPSRFFFQSWTKSMEYEPIGDI